MRTTRRVGLVMLFLTAGFIQAHAGDREPNAKTLHPIDAERDYLDRLGAEFDEASRKYVAACRQAAEIRGIHDVLQYNFKEHVFYVIQPAASVMSATTASVGS